MPDTSFSSALVAPVSLKWWTKVDKSCCARSVCPPPRWTLFPMTQEPVPGIGLSANRGLQMILSDASVGGVHEQHVGLGPAQHVSGHRAKPLVASRAYSHVANH